MDSPTKQTSHFLPLIRLNRGDYFYEDNAFHWTTMLHAGSVSKVEHVLFHHRRERKGQTSSNFNLTGSQNGASSFSMDKVKQISAAAKLGGMLPNLYQTGQDLFSERSDLPFDESAKELLSYQQSAKAELHRGLARNSYLQQCNKNSQEDWTKSAVIGLHMQMLL